MKRLKTASQSTITDGRLSSLAILHIHTHKDIDADDVITELARLKGGLPLSYPIFCCGLAKTSEMA